MNAYALCRKADHHPSHHTVPRTLLRMACFPRPKFCSIGFRLMTSLLRHFLEGRDRDGCTTAEVEAANACCAASPSADDQWTAWYAPTGCDVHWGRMNNGTCVRSISPPELLYPNRIAKRNPMTGGPSVATSGPHSMHGRHRRVNAQDGSAFQEQLLQINPLFNELII